MGPEQHTTYAYMLSSCTTNRRTHARIHIKRRSGAARNGSPRSAAEGTQSKGGSCGAAAPCGDRHCHAPRPAAAAHHAPRVPVRRAPPARGHARRSQPPHAQGRGTTKRLTTAARTGSSPARRERRTGRIAAHRAPQPDRGSGDEQQQQHDERATTNTDRRSSRGTSANQTRKDEGDEASAILLFRCFYSTTRRASCQ